MADEARNIAVQVNQQAKSNLESTATVIYDGDEVDTEALEKWFEVLTLGKPTNLPANGSFRAGEEWMVQIDCYAHAGRHDLGEGNVYTAWELADAVYAAFDRQEVSVLDWDTSGGGSAVGTLHFGRIEADRVPPGDRSRDLMRVACTCSATFTPA